MRARENSSHDRPDTDSSQLRWYEVEATDGAVLVDLGQVSYLRVESGEHRVGF
jgi:hypothetical protein